MTTNSKVVSLFVLPLVIAGCTSTNPKPAFDDVAKQVSARTGQAVRWMRADTEQNEVEAAISARLRTNLTAQGAVSIALLNNRALQAEFEEIGISQAGLAQASRLRNPSYSGNFRLPTQGPMSLNTENILTQDLLDLLTLPARKKIAAGNLEQTKLRMADTVLKTAMEAKVAFYTVQARQQLLKRLRAVVEVNEAGVDLSTRQHSAGNITDLELASQQVSFQEAKLAWGKAQAQLRIDHERLNRLLGLWGTNTDWTIADELPSLPEAEPSLENLETLAINQRLDLAAARSEQQNVEAALRLKKSVRWIPAVSVGVDAERNLDHSWVVGPTLDLEVPLFDQGQPAVARLAAQYRQAQRRLEALATDIRSEVRQARDALIAARDLAEFYEKVYLPQRTRIVNETLLQYNAMQKGTFELITAKEHELNAEREYAEAGRDYWIARAQLERALGGRLPERAVPSPSPNMPKRSSDKHQEAEH